MDRIQRRVVDMFRNVSRWIVNNLTALSDVPEIEQTDEDLQTRLANIDRLASFTKESTKGATKEKAQAKTNLVDSVMAVVSALKFFAYKTGNLALRNEVSFCRTDFTRSSSQSLQNLAEFVLTKADAVKDHEKATLYLLTPETIAALGEALEYYRIHVTGPRQITVERKSANQQLEDLIDDTSDFLDDLVDQQMEAALAKDFPELLMSYQNARIIVDN